ncbi:MAG: rhodanese-like domain-containing protein [Desulfurococcales archaeon]|nr:rhodanese-like domain-containing protein [Desulfurococcales archaeon]
MGSYREIGVEEARDLAEKGALIIDVRSPDSYNKEHIKGAISIPLEDLDKRINEIPRDRPVVVYCGSRECKASYYASRKLAAAGYDNIYRFVDGLKGWKEAGLPTESS